LTEGSVGGDHPPKIEECPPPSPGRLPSCLTRCRRRSSSRAFHNGDPRRSFTLSSSSQGAGAGGDRSDGLVSRGAEPGDGPPVGAPPPAAAPAPGHRRHPLHHSQQSPPPNKKYAPIPRPRSSPSLPPSPEKVRMAVPGAEGRGEGPRRGGLEAGGGALTGFSGRWGRRSLSFAEAAGMGAT